MNPQVWTFCTIAQDTFIERFGPKPNHLDLTAGFDFGNGGCLFALAGKELRHVMAQKPRTIWTVIEGDECLVIESGMHFVNRLGFLVTSVPFEARVTYTVTLDRERRTAVACLRAS